MEGASPTSSECNRSGFQARADPEAVQKVLRGDGCAFAEFYTSWRPQAIAWSRRFCGCAGVDPEDVVQEAFLTLWIEARAGRLKGVEHLEGWLAVVMRRIATTTGSRTSLILTGDEFERDVSGEQDAPQAAGEEPVWFARLSAPLQTLLRLRILEEETYGEIANALIITDRAARLRVHRALRILQRTLPPPSR